MELHPHPRILSNRRRLERIIKESKLPPSIWDGWIIAINKDPTGIIAGRYVDAIESNLQREANQY